MLETKSSFHANIDVFDYMPTEDDPKEIESELDKVPDVALGKENGLIRYLIFRIYKRTPPFDRKAVIRGAPGCKRALLKINSTYA